MWQSWSCPPASQDLEKKDSNPEKSDDETEKKAENDEEEAEEEEYDEEDIEEVRKNVLDVPNLSYTDNLICSWQENDYIDSYFDNGEDFAAGSDDNMDGEATYWARGSRVWMKREYLFSAERFSVFVWCWTLINRKLSTDVPHSNNLFKIDVFISQSRTVPQFKRHVLTTCNAFWSDKIKRV